MKILIDTDIKEICFDMDGTLCDFYGVEGWLDALHKGDVSPYLKAKPMHNLSQLTRMINTLQKRGCIIKIISWNSKVGTSEFKEAIRQAKLKWLKKHMPSVNWDEVHVLEHGTPKYLYGNGILFDDEDGNREEWHGTAFKPEEILEVLKLLK